MSIGTSASLISMRHNAMNALTSWTICIIVTNSQPSSILLFNLSNKVIQQVDQNIEQRIAVAKTKLRILFIGLGLLFVVILYLYLGMYFSIKNTID